MPNATPLYDHAASVIRRIYDSRLDGAPVLSMARYFPDGRRFAGAWHAIRDEALQVAAGLGRVPRFHEVMPEQADISANDGLDWRILILKAYGVDFEENHALCPTLADLLADCPEVLSASISFLAPRKVVPEHRGPVRGVLRFYLPLVMPRDALGRPAAVLSVAGTDHRLRAGEAMLWDDTFPHAVRNESDEVRVVLLMDVWRREMPADMRLLSRLIVRAVRLGIRSRRVAERVRRRDER
jgi:aspartate beta-hydroxylase